MEEIFVLISFVIPFFLLYKKVKVILQSELNEYSFEIESKLKEASNQFDMANKERVAFLSGYDVYEVAEKIFSDADKKIISIKRKYEKDQANLIKRFDTHISVIEKNIKTRIVDREKIKNILIDSTKSISTELQQMPTFDLFSIHFNEFRKNQMNVSQFQEGIVFSKHDTQRETNRCELQSKK